MFSPPRSKTVSVSGSEFRLDPSKVIMSKNHDNVRNQVDVIEFIADAPVYSLFP